LAMFIPLMIILFGFVLFSKILKDILCNYIPQKAILFSKNIRKKILS
jgi:D-alanyl-lipoteichoic acid acyltransferase DltB (MBOAT superfamily)